MFHKTLFSVTGNHQVVNETGEIKVEFNVAFFLCVKENNYYTLIEAKAEINI